MRTMKDSGIEWIGEIPEDWEVCKLKYLAKVQTGNTPSMTNEELFFSKDKGIPWIKAENLNNYYSIEKTEQYLTPEGVNEGRLFPKNTIYICCIASIGKVGFSCIEASCNQQINALSFNDKFYWKYGFYLSKAQEEEYLLLASGNVVKILNSERQKNMFCPFPPLSEQQQIADFLDTKVSEIDSTISKTRESIEEYKKLKQAIIAEAVTKGLNSNAKMKDSGIEWIGEIPEDWEVRALKSLFHIFSGTTPKSDNPEFWDEDIKWVTPADFSTENVFISGGKRNLSKKGLKSYALEIIPRGSLIFSKRAPIGKVCINTDEMCTNQGCLACVKKVNLDIKFFYYLLSVFTELFELLGSGTTFKEISLSAFSDFRLPVPPLSEQQQIADYLDQKCSEIDALITKKEQLVAELEAYKKSLIYEVVTGKRSV